MSGRSEECQDLLVKLKTILPSFPVPRAPDFQETIVLSIDACDVGVWAVLLQAGEDDFEKPVAYLAKKSNIKEHTPWLRKKAWPWWYC